MMMGNELRGLTQTDFVFFSVLVCPIPIRRLLLSFTFCLQNSTHTRTNTHPHTYSHVLAHTMTIDGLVPQRQAPPPPRPSLQLAPGSASYGSSSSPPEREALPQRASLKASKKGPPPPEKPSRQHNQDSLRSNYSDTTLINSSPKSAYRSHHYDSSSDYTSSSSNRSTFKGVFSNIVSSMSGKEKIHTIHNCSGKQKDVVESFRRTGQKKKRRQGNKKQQPGVRLILVCLYPS